MNASELASRALELAPISQTALKLLNLLDHPSVDNDEIIQLLKFDNVLTAKLLRACNSPVYALREPVSSVDQAVLFLGHQEILHVLIAISFSGSFSVALPGYAAERNELWHHSIITAVACETMAKDHLPLNVEPSVAFTAGLLHDIGKLALNEVLTEEDLITMRSCIREKSQSYAEAEQQVLGFDHAEVGACLLKAWKLPAEIVEAVAHHHHPVCRPRLQLSALVHAADCVAHEMGANFGRDAFAVRVDGQVADALQLTPERMDGFMLAIHDALPQADCLEKLA